jgi:hypothetical protein
MVVMSLAARSEGGAMSGLLNLSRNLGLISGAALIGAIFASATGTAELATAPPEGVAAGMRTSFAVAAGLAAAALAALGAIGAMRVAGLSPRHG